MAHSLMPLVESASYLHSLIRVPCNSRYDRADAALVPLLENGEDLSFGVGWVRPLDLSCSPLLTS